MIATGDDGAADDAAARCRLDVSERQVVRLITESSFVEEDAAVLRAGLLSAPYITVEDAGAGMRAARSSRTSARRPQNRG